MFIISIPLFVDTTTVASSRHVTSKGLPSEQIIKIQDILSTITTFGSVSIETSPPSVVIKTTKDKQTQIVCCII
jgi:hypothetical protein